MMHLCGIVIAHDEALSLPWVIERMGMPYIAILDAPTAAVEDATRAALRIYRTPPQEGPHTYRWGLILDLIRDAALEARRLGFGWILRADADEDWHDAREEIPRAAAAGCTIVDFPVLQHRPTLETVTAFDPRTQAPTVPGDPLHLAPHKTQGGGNFYQRAWALAGEWRIMGGGHIIHRPEARVHMAGVPFRHYPAPDLSTLRRKCQRLPAPEDRRKNPGWHIQYQGVAVPAPPTPPPAPQTAPDIHIVYHIAQMGRWREILAEQVATLEQCGLLPRLRSFAAVTVGPGDPPQLPAHPCVIHAGDLDLYEFPSLSHLQASAARRPGDLYLYIHTKGVSKPPHRRWKDDAWRRYMMYACVERWSDCVQGLSSGADVAGCEWYADCTPCHTGVGTAAGHGFFAGNFWWARGAYLAALPPVSALDRADRWQAEAWLGLGPAAPKVHEILNLGCRWRKGMFPATICRATYADRPRRLYIDVRRPMAQCAEVNRLASSIPAAVVFCRGMRQEWLTPPHALSCVDIPAGAEVLPL